MNSEASLRLQSLIKRGMGRDAAILVTGPWGSGKSHACETVKRNLSGYNFPGYCGGMKFVVISMFGIATQEQLNTLILNEYRSQHGYVKSFAFGAAREVALTFVRRITGRAKSDVEVALNTISGDENTVFVFEIGRVS